MKEVVVIGGGIAGATVALELVDRGSAVTVVDAERVGGAATGASAGMLAPQYESAGPGPLFDLGVSARSEWSGFQRRLEGLTDRPLGLRWDGLLVANRTQDDRSAAERDILWQRETGQEAALLDVDAAGEIQPGLPDPDRGGPESYLWLPAEGQIDSQQLALALPEALAARDVRILVGQRVVEILSRRGVADGVRLADGRTLTADAIVLAAGAWSGEIIGLPRTLPVRPVRGQMLRLPAPEPGLRTLLATHTGRYLVPREDGTVLAGSTMDEVGFDRSLSEEGLDDVLRSAAQLLPTLADAHPLEQWADLRPLTPDGLPVFGPDPDLEGLVYATGYGRNGILLGPLIGRVVADLVATGQSSVDGRPFAPGRFLTHGPG